MQVCAQVRRVVAARIAKSSSEGGAAIDNGIVNASVVS